MYSQYDNTYTYYFENFYDSEEEHLMKWYELMSSEDTIIPPTGRRTQLTKHEGFSNCVEGGTKEHYTCNDCDAKLIKIYNDSTYSNGTIYSDSVFFDRLNWYDIITEGCEILPPQDAGQETYILNHNEYPEYAEGVGNIYESALPWTANHDYMIESLNYNEYLNRYIGDLRAANSIYIDAGELSIAPFEGKHNLVKVNGSTFCEENGWQDYYRCQDCGLYFYDNYDDCPIGDDAAFEEWKQGEGAVPPLGHSYTDVEASGACLAHSICERCGKTFIAEEDPNVVVHSGTIVYSVLKPGDYIKAGTLITAGEEESFGIIIDGCTSFSYAQEFDSLKKVEAVYSKQVMFASGEQSIPLVYTEVPSSAINMVLKSEKSSTEALVNNEKATIRFIWELNPLNGVTINSFGAYIIPFALFNNVETEPAIVTITPDEPVNAGDTFAADLTGIPSGAFEKEIYAVPFINNGDLCAESAVVAKVNDIRIDK